jgi:hypothetical protein
MAHRSTPSLRPVPRPYRWPVRAVSVLLVVQAIGLVGVIVYFAFSIDWGARDAADLIKSRAAQDTAIFITLFTGVVVAAFLTATSAFLRWPGAWLVAMGLQGLILAYCLDIYFFTVSHLRASMFIYLIMLYSIIMVLYLNTTDVRLAFFTKPAAGPLNNPDFRHSEGDDAQRPREQTQRADP